MWLRVSAHLSTIKEGNDGEIVHPTATTYDLSIKVCTWDKQRPPLQVTKSFGTRQPLLHRIAATLHIVLAKEVNECVISSPHTSKIIACVNFSTFNCPKTFLEMEVPI
jgi:hypothetical protein